MNYTIGQRFICQIINQMERMVHVQRNLTVQVKKQLNNWNLNQNIFKNNEYTYTAFEILNSTSKHISNIKSIDRIVLDRLLDFGRFSTIDEIYQD